MSVFQTEYGPTVYRALCNRVTDSIAVDNFAAFDPVQDAFVLVSLIGSGVHRRAEVEAVVRIEGGLVIVEYDHLIVTNRMYDHDEPEEATILHALVQAGIPREDIVLAYRSLIA